MKVTIRSVRQTFVAALAVVGLLGVAACSAEAPVTAAGHDSRTSGIPSTATPTPTPTTAPVKWVTTPKAGAEDVSVDTRVSARTEDGTLTKASLSYLSKKGNKVPVKGWLESGTWTSSDLLEPGVKYTFSLTATDQSGEQQTTKRSFSTADLTLDDQIWTKVYPDGGTVGIGMPVIATFDLPVVDKATFEKHMEVTSQPAQEGSWYWLSDREAHWRPQNYWKPGTKVHVEANLNGVPAGGGRFGEQTVVTDFTIGRAVIAKVNLTTHMMDVNINGKKAKSIPISGGRPGWETRSGVKVIMEKFTDFTMKAESIGLKEGDKDYYHDVKVKRALRITHSGEFLHSAPWSVAQQGHENVSHGCTGMSDANSIWLYDNMRVGDVVETVGSKKPMTMGNGYADWNLSWATWQQGSAL
ncbi:MAG TPA: Ig-like domain-containing protein [Intrasporangium sp.]|uniref:L,D-transpeptidase n=1 Tax=Intrasporangium sp. TaxID=1925024 RepID=UPI002F947073